MSLQITIKEVDDIDLNQYCLLQQQSFEAIFAESRIDSSYLDPDFFKWKYNTPAGKARIAVVEESNCMLASVAMYPVYIVVKGVKTRGWHFVEAAVLPLARGKGFFKRCMSLLIDSLMADEIIYVFPNSSSMHGTIKAGFRHIEECNFYARCFFNVFKKGRSAIETGVFFTAAQDIYADAMSTKQDVVVFRDAAYMNWRYKQHPHFSYYTFSPVENGRVMGNIVARPVIIKGIRMLLIMEMHSLNDEVKKEMISFVREVAKKENCFIAGIFSCKNGKPSLAATGMMPLPSYVLPKRHILMAYTKHSASKLESENWFCQTGDWDAF